MIFFQLQLNHNYCKFLNSSDSSYFPGEYIDQKRVIKMNNKMPKGKAVLNILIILIYHRKKYQTLNYHNNFF